MGRLPVIDALRGVAVLSVLLFHSRIGFAPTADEASVRPFASGLEHQLSFGWLGVSIFFAISGWCIARRARLAWTAGETEVQFVIERVLRIFPVYWAALILSIALRLGETLFNHLPLRAALPPNAWAAAGDWLLLQPYFGTAAFLVVSWSLVCELGYYVLMAMALAARRRGVSTSWLLALGFALVAAAYFAPPLRWYQTLNYWPDFFAGAFAWQASRLSGGRKWPVTIGGLALLALISRRGWSEPFHLTAIATAVLLLFAATRDLPPSRILRAALALGAISYPLYLVHITVMSPWNNLMRRVVAPGSVASFATWILGIALALAAGWALHRWCETPVERWRRSLFGRAPDASIPVIQARPAEAP